MSRKVNSILLAVAFTAYAQTANAQFEGLLL